MNSKSFIYFLFASFEKIFPPQIIFFIRYFRFFFSFEFFFIELFLILFNNYSLILQNQSSVNHKTVFGINNI